MTKAVSLLLVLVAVCVATPIIPVQYPLYKQCDPRWGNDWMNGNNPQYDTICDQGCAMSSLSMLLGGKGYQVNGTTSDPGTLNQWLRANNGYVTVDGDPDNLVLDAADKISIGIHFITESEKPSEPLMQYFIDVQNPMMIAHVHNRTHFVLVVGYDNDGSGTFYVNDPFYNTKLYHYSDIADILFYYVEVNTN